MVIIPAILSHSFEELTQKLGQLSDFSHVQIDICDGVVGKEKTWLPNNNEVLPPGFSYQFDLMVRDWKQVSSYFSETNTSSLVAHVDGYTDEEIEELVSFVISNNIKLGISLSNDKPIQVHIDVLKKLQQTPVSVFAQVMGIRSIGQQGQPFDMESISRVRAIKQEFPEMVVQVDGGMNPDTAREVVSAGASTVVVGSYLFKEGSVKDAVGRMEAVCADGLC